MTDDRPQTSTAPPPEVEDRRLDDIDRGGSLMVLAILSLLAGAASGLLGALFRLALEQADRWRTDLIEWSHGRAVLGFLIVAGTCAGATALAAWLVRRFSPYATGSGIPHVESVLNEDVPYAPLHLIPVKFIGGVLAIGAGLALGREGPSVQIGASVSHIVGKVFRRSWDDCRTLLAAGAGAGLATAFNAPIAGAAFVLEELVRRFDTRIAIAVFGASAAAITVARTMLGYEPDFHVVTLGFSGIRTAPLFLVFGVVVGGLGVAYNVAIVGALLGARRITWVPVEARAAIIGLAVAILAWFAPTLVGGGDNLTQNALSATAAGGALSLVFLLRFALGPLSYAAATPGGLFAPMLVLGAQSGLLFGTLCQVLLPGYAPDPLVFAVTGMAAFFTAVVRAPLTGIILAIELTGSYTQLLPMLGACFVAMLVPTLLRNAPIYDSLRELQGKFRT
jgi:CIC family chloride channel protein